MREHEIDGIHVREQGSGLPVVLVHAFPVDGRLYEPLLRSGVPGARLVVPDLPGFGSSASAHVTSLDDYADAVLRVCDGEGIDRFVCGGTSMGGYITFAVWRHAPERVDGLVLMDTRAGADADEARAGREQTAQRVEAEGTAFLAEEMVPKLLGPRTRTEPEIAEAVRTMITEATPAGTASALRAMAARPDATDDLGSMNVPALVVVGADDEITPPPAAHAMADALPRSRLEVVDGAGHLTPLEAPDETRRLLEGFVGSF